MAFFLSSSFSIRNPAHVGRDFSRIQKGKKDLFKGTLLDGYRHRSRVLPSSCNL